MLLFFFYSLGTYTKSLRYACGYLLIYLERVFQQDQSLLLQKIYHSKKFHECENLNPTKPGSEKVNKDGTEGTK